MDCREASDVARRDRWHLGGEEAYSRCVAAERKAERALAALEYDDPQLDPIVRDFLDPDSYRDLEAEKSLRFDVTETEWEAR